VSLKYNKMRKFVDKKVHHFLFFNSSGLSASSASSAF
jgi:hypothetical protein